MERSCPAPRLREGLDVLSHESSDRLSSALMSPWLPWSIIGLGILLRAGQYLANRSLWLDEAMLTLNLLHRSFTQLLSPLDYEQVAPVAFLMVEKLAIVSLGESEYALRLFPLLAGLVALPAFYGVAHLCLPPQAALISLVFFALSGPLVYFASEVKQYSSDVAIALLLTLLALRALRQGSCSWRDAVFLGVGGAAAIWFSHPAIFILGGIGVALAIAQFERRAGSDLAPLLLIGAFWMANFAVLYLGFYQAIETRGLSDYWQKSFMPLPPSTLADIKWFWAAFAGLLRDPVGLGSLPIAAMAFGIGCATIFVANKTKLVLLLSPLGFAFVASGLHYYPFKGRLLVFIAPAILLCVAAGMFQILKYSGRFAWMMKCVVVLALIVPSLYKSAYYLLVQPILREEIAPVLQHIRRHWQEGDALYVYYGAVPAFRYYQRRFDFSQVPWIEGVAAREHWQSYLDDLDRLRGRQRVWILLSHTYRGSEVDEKKLILHHLDQIGERLSSNRAHGAEAYLYDLGTITQVQAPVKSPLLVSPVSQSVIGSAEQP
jgi:uncharacterized membrane protein